MSSTCQHEWGDYKYDTGRPRFVRDEVKGRRCSICLIQRSIQEKPTKKTIEKKAVRKRAPARPIDDMLKGGSPIPRRLIFCGACNGGGFANVGSFAMCPSCKGSGVFFG